MHQMKMRRIDAYCVRNNTTGKELLFVPDSFYRKMYFIDMAFNQRNKLFL